VQGVKIPIITKEDVYIILDDYSFLCMPTNTVLKIVDDRGDANYTPHTHLQLVKEHYHAHIKDFDFYSEVIPSAGAGTTMASAPCGSTPHTLPATKYGMLLG